VFGLDPSRSLVQCFVAAFLFLPFLPSLSFLLTDHVNSSYGIKTVNVKPILKALPVIFAHTDKNVRLEGTQLTHELYRYLGPALEPHLAELKPVQVKELNEQFAELDAKGEGKGKGAQSRWTRKQQRERDVKEAEGALEGAREDTDAGEQGEKKRISPTLSTLSVAHRSENPEAENLDQDEGAADVDMDPYDLAEPVDVLAKLPPGFYDKLASSKWKERKEEALDPLFAVVNAIRIKDGPLDELVRALAGRMSDANIACVTAAAQCIECLAKGLRSSFAKHKPTVVPPVLEKLKEKKQSVVDALAAALDAVFASVRRACPSSALHPLISCTNPEAGQYLGHCRGHHDIHQTQEPCSQD
jgi:cytoskeleton-associated protein 5